MMIKYMEFEDYRRLGEINHHWYGWRNDFLEDIIINAYEDGVHVLKIKVDSDTNTFTVITPTDSELDNIIGFMGGVDTVNSKSKLHEFHDWSGIVPI